MSVFEISKELCRDHRLIMKVVKNITKLRTQSKEKGFKNLLPKASYSETITFDHAQIFAEVGIEKVKKDKRCLKLYVWASIKKISKETYSH